jgi:hypothetical protein
MSRRFTVEGLQEGETRHSNCFVNVGGTISILSLPMWTKYDS